MVLQKRLDYGSSGYQVPAVPHVPRSARGKRSIRKKVEDNWMGAFDLLATVAGRLLSERQNSLTPCNMTGTSNPTAGKDIIKQEQFENEKPLKAEAFDQGSCDESNLGSEIVIQRQRGYASKEHSQTPNATASSPASAFVNSDNKDSFAGESIINSIGPERGYSLGTNTIPKKCSTRRGIPVSMESYECEGDGIKTPLQAEWQTSGKAVERNARDMYSSEDPMDLDAKCPALISSDSSAEAPSCRDHVPYSSSVPKCRDGMEFSVYRDDDENSSGCTHPSTVTTNACRAQHIGDCRMRKLLTSKYWKVDPTISKDGEIANTDVEMKPVFRSRRMPCTCLRTRRSSFKRRKLFERCSISASDGGIFHDGISNPARKSGIKLEASDSPATLHGANGASSSTTGEKSSNESGDYHVRLRIKSFKVPELFIEIPESATVGSLKRTVLEAVTAILGGGLRVGILLQGKKVRDDSKTLHQAGIAHAEKLDNLGFTLEPNPRQASAHLTSPEDPYLLHPGDAPEPLARIPPAKPAPYRGGGSDATPQPVLTSAANCPESDRDSVHSPADAPSLDKPTANSRALVPVPQMDVEALSVVPLRKSRRSEMVQRRIRRPFSVAEVEALVQAVEKLGTGRWRDVKLRAFDDAKHRTYVDLKDKWKTLVHTARISPQQRRGEPVPQELLDRVLSAHAYWSQQQARIQVKPPAQTCLLI